MPNDREKPRPIADFAERFRSQFAMLGRPLGSGTRVREPGGRGVGDDTRDDGGNARRPWTRQRSRA